MKNLTKILFALIVLCFITQSASSQDIQKPYLGLLEHPTELNKKRFWVASGLSLVGYTGTMLALNQAWYADYPKTDFHTFNDWGEWENMDKAGHLFSAYTESALAFQVASWTGMNNKQSALTAFGVSTLIQSSIEVLDGYSDNWGFSWYDLGANTLGSALYTAQQLAWKEQRIRIKFSYTPINHSDASIKAKNTEKESSLKDRAEEQFGTFLPERILKDYSAQTYWLSVNPSSFLSQENKFPKWLNLSVGYGAQQILGAYGNGWSRGNSIFRPENYERERQLYFSFDLDLRKIKTRNKTLRKILNTLNFIKIPSPTIEFNSNGKTIWHLLYF